MKLKLELEYEVDSDNFEDAVAELEERFASENTAEVEFWDNIQTAWIVRICKILRRVRLTKNGFKGPHHPRRNKK